MKKFLGFLMMATVMAMVLISCNKDDNNNNNTPEASLIKTITFAADWNRGASGYEFFYDADKKVTNFDRTYEGGADGAFVYDYSVTGKLTLTKNGEAYGSYEINDQGYITKDFWSESEWASYEYDANGYLIKGIEHWGDADHLKYVITITDGNVSRITTYDDDGVTEKKIKEFTYTIGDNVDNLQQANVIDNDWKPIGNFYGKASKKLVDFFEYWDPRESPISKSKSTLTYSFDASDRPATVTKTLTDMTTEVWNYTYYENVK
jgi:hypothetical protein